MHKESFLNYLRDERRYSPHTVIAYKNDLNQFFEFLFSRYPRWVLGDITHRDIRAWIVSCLDAGVSARSVNRKITALKSFYKFLLREKTVEDNPMNKVIAPRIPGKIPVFVEKDRMDELLDKVEFSDGETGERDKLILLLFYSTGIRLSELINLKVNDVDLDKGAIKVLGKGARERMLPIPAELQGAIAQYLRNTNPYTWLFLTESGKKMYPKLVYRVVNTYLSKVTTISKKSPHVLRHTFATHMLNNGADLNAIKEFLGHASLSATQVYTHNSISRLKKIYKQAHPKA